MKGNRLETVITSPQNERIKQAKKLRMRKYRQEFGQFLVEGMQLIWMALEAGRQPQQVFYCPELMEGEAAAGLFEKLKQSDAALIPVSIEAMETLAERENLQGFLATFALFAGDIHSLRQAQGLLVVVDRLQDPGNLGTIIRTADAVGAEGVLLIEPCVDIFDPKTVRGTMGSLFNVPVFHSQAPAEDLAYLQTIGYVLVGADGKTGESWGRSQLHGPVALVLGNEARGLSPDVKESCRQFVALPILGKAESLNVSIAGGVLMYLWLLYQQPDTIKFTSAK
jgi:RNA methyltransferase, TrmH family